MPEYDENFLGVVLPLPTFSAARVADILPASPELPDGLAVFANYAVATDKRYRAPAYSVLHIDQTGLKTTKRKKTWKPDPRVGDWQLGARYYDGGDANPWDKGHMADRQSAGWGATLTEAQAHADATFVYANACLQHKNLNEDEWVALETWVLKLDIVRNGRLTVFTGPIFGEHPRIVQPPGLAAGIVPVAFFKIACFVNATTGKLEVRAFIIYQDTDAMRDREGRKTFNFTKYQVTVTEIEKLTGLRFPAAVKSENPLLYHEDAVAGRKLGIRSFPERVDINLPEDIIHGEEPRTPVADDEVEVYIAAALVNPTGGAKEWVSLANYEQKAVSIAGWTLVDRAGRVLKLKGSIPAGGSVVLRGAGLHPVRLPDKETGVLTLLNARGERIDRADYSTDELKALRAGGRRNQPVNFHTYRTGLKPR